MAPATCHRLTILPEGVSVPVLPRETMLAAICRAGFTYRFGCRRGGCGVCRVQVISGDVRYERPVDASTLSDTERRSDTWLSCRAVLESDAAIAMEPAHRLRRVVPFAFGMGNAGFGRAERGLAGPAGH